MKNLNLRGINLKFGPVLISLFWVIFIWGFWKWRVYALGFNAAIFFLLILVFFGSIYDRQKLWQKANFSWFFPLILISLSFAIFENPFIKGINLLVLPLLFLVFYNYGQLENKRSKIWNANFFLSLFGRIFLFFDKVGQAVRQYTGILVASENEKRAVAKRIIVGLILFLLIAFIVIIPLLSSADTIFAQKIDFIYSWFKEFISLTFVAKIFVFSILSVFFLSLALAWQNAFTYNEQINETKTDSIISGIVIGGILLLYILFLAIQFRYLWVRELPVDFRATEALVKSGFWQLLFLSIINIGIFLVSFQKTNSLVQKILALFTAASFFLLLSAGYRMFMYVAYYGFSYEKFYASYAVIFCAILLIWLFVRFFKGGRANILKFIAFLFLWMYALVTIFPVEQFVMRANVSLSARPDSRINLYELSMLSPDVLGYVKAHKNTELSYNRNQPRENLDIKPLEWKLWIEEREDMIKRKKWYEMNLSNLWQ